MSSVLEEKIAFCSFSYAVQLNPSCTKLFFTKCRENEVLRASRTLFMHKPNCYISLGIQPGYEIEGVLVPLIDNLHQNLDCSGVALLVLLDFSLVF